MSNETKLNDSLIITVNNNSNETDGFSCISEQLFIDKIHKIGHIGWSIYALLFKNHNTSFGNNESGNYGFACPSEAYMANILNRHENTIKQCIPLIEQQHLIKVVPQKPYTYWDTNGNAITTYAPNHYIVKAKFDTWDKYNINYKEKNEIKANLGNAV